MQLIWINDNFVNEDDAAVSLRDTGLLHGAGVFTTMRSYRGRVFQLGAHLRRLRGSCEALFIPLQYRDEQLTSAVEELLRRNDLADARLRLTVTRGAAQQDPLHGTHLMPTVFLTAAPVEPYPPEYYQRGLTVILLDEQKLNPYDLQAGHKTLNYLSRLAALREANRRGAGEALWFNVHNDLQSGSISNVFIVKGGAVITPPTKWEFRDSGSVVLPGVTRSSVLDLAKANEIETRLERIDVNQLLDADEVFLTNSIMQVMPVCRIERKAIGADKPGPVTVQFANALASAIETAAGESGGVGVIAPLDREGCRQLAEAIGDTPTWSISIHALLTDRGRAYVVGDPRQFDAALVAPDYSRNEPQAWGGPGGIWQILSELNGWTAVEVPRDIAPPLAKLVTDATGRKTKLVDGLFFLGDASPPPGLEHPAVRLLSLDDLDLLVAAPHKLSGGDVESARRMLTEAIYAAAVIDGRIVARVEAYARSPRYANLGAYVLDEFRGRGLAPAAASLVTRAVFAAGQTPVWSTGETNPASQAVARKLGFREVARTSYVVLD